MNEEPTYEELELPHYRNNSTAITIKGKVGKRNRVIKIPTHDIPKIDVLAGLQLMLVSDTGGGKTQVMKDITRHYFNGNVSEGGHVNWLIGRKDTSVEDLFTGWDKDQQKYVVKEDRVKALVNVVDEMNRSPEIVQNDFFDLAEGERVIDGEDRKLGKDDYVLFLTAVNLNRINGDFGGTSDMDRAMLSRSRINLDLDFYDITERDEAAIVSQGKPKLKLAPLRDISEKILAAYDKIVKKSEQANPFLDVYLMILGSGLKYCKEDELKKKRRNWPQLCGSCDMYDKGVCGSLKQSEPRTTQAIKRFAVGLDYLIELKEGKTVDLDPLDLIFEAAKFTAYHGNLNENGLMSEYSGDDQHMMNTVLEKIKGKVLDIKKYLDRSIREALNGNVVTKFVKYTIEKEMISPYDKNLIDKLDVKNKEAEKKKLAKIQYEVVEPFKKLEEIGLGTKWVEPYLKTLAENAKKD